MQMLADTSSDCLTEAQLVSLQLDVVMLCGKQHQRRSFTPSIRFARSRDQSDMPTDYAWSVQMTKLRGICGDQSNVVTNHV